MSRQIVQDQADDGAQVVGMAWLNAPRAVCLPLEYGGIFLTQRLVSRLSPSVQVECSLGIFFVSPSANWTLSPGKQVRHPLRDKIGGLEVPLPES